MGGLARLKEKFSQKAPKGKNGNDIIKASVKDRAHVTYAEASKFAEQLKGCRKSIRAMRQATEGMLLQTERALSQPLPRIYEYDPDQQKSAPTSEPIPAAAQSLTRTSGSGLSNTGEDSGVRVSHLNPIAMTLTRRLEQEVIHPMDQWLKLHADFKLKLKTLERRRLDYDSDRRAYARLEAKKTKAINGGVAVKPEITTQLQSKEHTMAAKKTAFDSYEQEIFEELSALVSDAGALHTFLEAALKLESSALLSSVGPGPISILENPNQYSAEGPQSYAGEDVGEEDVSAYPSAPTGKLPTPLGDHAPTDLASSNPTQNVTGTENHSNNVSASHGQKGSKLPTGTTNAPQPIAA
ncbi:hypothetical protein WJX73_001090 [Symbiochloris irregularis]|uniref:BAR domain-containing protein n=1 Tax=Symbiochloris irregularis TaxID=706552 RepID=A0AAW1PNM3_9CHLO